MKSLTERPLGASQSQSKANFPPSGRATVCRVEDAVKQLQPLFPVQHMGGGAHDLEAVEGVGLDTGEPRPRRRKVLRLDGQGHILGFHIAVAAPLILEAEYPGRISRTGSRSSPWGRMPNSPPPAHAPHTGC